MGADKSKGEYIRFGTPVVIFDRAIRKKSMPYHLLGRILNPGDFGYNKQSFEVVKEGALKLPHIQGKLTKYQITGDETMEIHGLSNLFQFENVLRKPLLEEIRVDPKQDLLRYYRKGTVFYTFKRYVNQRAV
jgi:hypothetical protein